MNILALENELSSSRGGQELSLLTVCEGLAARGHAVTLAYVTSGDLAERYSRFCRRLIRVGNYAVDRTRTWRSLWSLATSLWATRCETPDVVYANQYMDSPFARLVALRAHRPFVCHLRLPPPEVFCGQYRWGMNGTTRLIANSEQTRRDYAAHGFAPGRIDVIYNGIDLQACRPSLSRQAMRERLGLPPSSFVVAYAGRLHPGKGLDALIDAVAAMRTPVDLVIAGREHDDRSGRRYEDELRGRAKQRVPDGRVHMVGHIAPVADLFAAADVTVLPSVVSETFGRVIVESMACGTPVIASRVGGIPEILTGEFATLLVPPGAAAALAAKLEAMRGWQTADPRLADRCRAHARQFDVTNTVVGVEAVFRRVLDEWRDGSAVSAATAAVR